ncbi:Hsp20/alpha crystallin family protein [Pistricoccus aurantiacus]|uniref:Hsp20/alpha crystallin family protein n=1 Tax=Pistricoccus aurantiacus TaxID=1883414 RepID=UPI00363B42D4
MKKEMTQKAASHDEKQQEVATQQQQRRSLTPMVDIFERDEALQVIADMPGVTQESLHIEVDNNVLSIEGDIKLDMPEGLSPSYAEVRGDRYARRFTLSQEIDTEAIEAKISNGVLHLTLPKRETHRRRRIDVKTA